MDPRVWTFLWCYMLGGMFQKQICCFTSHTMTSSPMMAASTPQIMCSAIGEQGEFHPTQLSSALPTCTTPRDYRRTFLTSFRHVRSHTGTRHIHPAPSQTTESPHAGGQGARPQTTLS